jgi:2,3-bisphosphoglycerate-independent phosphoglycerate mutase
LHATEHRIGLKVHGPNLSNDITGTDPLKDNLKLIECKATEAGDANAEMTADLVNKLSQAMVTVLSQEPLNLEREKQGLPTANIVILRGCGVKIKLDPFLERHGLNGFAICPTCILNG